MARRPKNPNWKEDLTFALSRGVGFTSACKYAQISLSTARRYQFSKEKTATLSDYHNTIIDMRKKGKTLEEISSEINFCISRISNYCTKHGIKKPSKLEIRY